jgi:hypothetical protein
MMVRGYEKFQARQKEIAEQVAKVSAVCLNRHTARRANLGTRKLE